MNERLRNYVRFSSISLLISTFGCDTLRPIIEDNFFKSPRGAITAETLTIVPLEITSFTLTPSTPGTVDIDFCTAGRPLDMTLRVSVYTVPLQSRDTDPAFLDPRNWHALKELGVPCFDTNASNPDHPVWNTTEYQEGIYILQGEAMPPEARGDWSHPSVQREYTFFDLQK